MSWSARAMLRALACASLVGFGCKNLTEIPAGTCGNRVIEKSEACDGFDRYGVRCRAPGEAQQCQLDCSADADACPANSGCELALGICRPLTGHYVPIGKPVEGNAHSLRAADLDADRRADLLSFEARGPLSASRFRVHYFDRLDAAPQTLSVPLTVNSLDLASVSGDGSDIVYANGQVGVLLGQPDRTLLSQTYPTYFLPDTDVRLTGALYPYLIDDNSVLLILAAGAGKIGLFYPGAQQLEKLGELSGSISDLVAEPAIGDLRRDEDHPCSEAAFALNGASEVLVYSICRPRGEHDIGFRDQADVLRVPFEAGVVGGPLITDMDGDMKPDLLVASADDLYVVWGDGDALSAPERFLPRFVGTSDIDPNFALSSLPLAADDFNGDGKADLIYPKLLLLSQPDNTRAAATYRIVESSAGDEWSAAQIGDLNRNGLKDVVLASRDSLDLQFLNGTGSDQLIQFVIPTDRPVDNLAIADLDGDMIQDLVFTHAGKPDDLREVVVAFGRDAGPPASPTIVARVEKLRQIGTLVSPPPANLGQLFVAYEQIDSTGATGSALAWLGSGGDHSLISQFGLTNFGSGAEFESAMALALKTGHFARPERLDMVVLGIAASDPTQPLSFDRNALNFWVVPDLPSGRGRHTRLDWVLDPRLHPLPSSGGARRPGEYPELNLLLAAADLEGDQQDELILVAPDATGQKCLLLRTDLSGDAAPVLTSSADPLEIDAACNQDSQLELSDLDADGAPDVVLLTGTPSRFLVFWNDGRGGFSSETSNELGEPGETPRAFAIFRPAKGAAPRLAYVTATQLRIIETAAGSRDLAGKAVTVEIELQDATGLSAADLDGDRASDIAIVDQGRIKLLQAELGTEWPP